MNVLQDTCTSMIYSPSSSRRNPPLSDKKETLCNGIINPKRLPYDRLQGDGFKEPEATLLTFPGKSIRKQ